MRAKFCNEPSAVLLHLFRWWRCSCQNILEADLFRIGKGCLNPINNINKEMLVNYTIHVSFTWAVVN